MLYVSINLLFYISFPRTRLAFPLDEVRSMINTAELLGKHIHTNILEFCSPHIFQEVVNSVKTPHSSCRFDKVPNRDLSSKARMRKILLLGRCTNRWKHTHMHKRTHLCSFWQNSFWKKPTIKERVPLWTTQSWFWPYFNSLTDYTNCPLRFWWQSVFIHHIENILQP